MSRIGARYTAKGYLEAIPKFHPLDNPETWRLITEGTKPKNPLAVKGKFEKHFGPHTVKIASNSRTSLTGNAKHLIQSYIPRCAEFMVGVVGTESESEPWAELGMMMQIMHASFKRNVFEFDFHPSFYCISQHALQRIYERNGGCDYEQFSKLVFAFFQELESNLSLLLSETVIISFRQNEEHDFLHPEITAVPCMGGLAIVEIANLSLRKDGLLAPIRVRLGAGNGLRGSLFDITSAPGYRSENIGGVDFHTSPHFMVRTFYAFEDLSDERKESLFFLDLLLQRIPKDQRFSAETLIANRTTKALAFSNQSDDKELHLAGPRSDAIGSLGWLKDPGEKFIFAWDVANI